MKFRTWAAALAATILAACGGSGGESGGDVIYVGVAGPMTGQYAQFGEALRNGVALAFEEVNAAGGVLGKRLKMVVGDDQGRPNEGVNVARNFVRDPRGIVAVLGHFNSGVSQPAGVVYNEAGIVMLTPASTNPSVTSPDRPFVFRNLPNDAQNGEMLAQFVVRDLGAERIAIYYANNEYGKGLAGVVEEKSKALGASVVDVANYDPNTDEDFRPTLTAWKGKDLDAIVFCGENPKGAQLIKQAREVGIEAPFAGGDGIASHELWTIGGEAAEGVFVVSYFHPENPDPEVKDFVKRFADRFGRPPDVWAAQAYDAARLLADAIARAGAADSAAIRDALAATDGWRGVTGPHRFRNGDAVGKRVIITRVEVTGPGEGRFAFHKEVVPEAAGVD